MTETISVIIPANNESTWIHRCLSALLEQDRLAGSVQIIVSANACTDGTEDIARGFIPAAHARGWDLVCLSSLEPGKPEAINRAELAATGNIRVYLDADVICEPELIGQIRSILAGSKPAYATGTLAVAQASSWVTRAYASLWIRLPFVVGGAVGAGFFAVNEAGRARWGAFPKIISDDTFVRLHFSPQERHEVPARYHWPMVEGWKNLVRVRRRQNAGVAEVYRLYPDLQANEGKAVPSLGAMLHLAVGVPLGFLVYTLISVQVRLRQPSMDWSRGR